MRVKSKLLTSTSGAGLAEYGLVVGLIVVLGVAAVAGTGERVKQAFLDSSAEVAAHQSGQVEPTTPPATPPADDETPTPDPDPTPDPIPDEPTGPLEPFSMYFDIVYLDHGEGWAAYLVPTFPGDPRNVFPGERQFASSAEAAAFLFPPDMPAVQVRGQAFAGVGAAFILRDPTEGAPSMGYEERMPTNALCAAADPVNFLEVPGYVSPADISLNNFGMRDEIPAAIMSGAYVDPDARGVLDASGSWTSGAAPLTYHPVPVAVSSFFDPMYEGYGFNVAAFTGSSFQCVRPGLPGDDSFGGRVQPDGSIAPLP